uniref:26S proteasome complex subunit SEM1 n=1 Tax=Pongo abelii TaxID=9601 RepID=A0A8I5YK62_PONAB
MSEKKQPVDLGLLEEDDEFEEFPAEDWAGLDEDEDAHVWEDNWDDDNVEDDFSNQLRHSIISTHKRWHSARLRRCPPPFPESRPSLTHTTTEASSLVLLLVTPPHLPLIHPSIAWVM